MSLDDYSNLFAQAGKQYGVDPAFLRAVATVESNGNPNAVSPAGALGIMQLMPATAKSMKVDATIPEQAIPAAAQILKQNLDRYGNSGDALMAYNAGPDRQHWNNPETQAYPKKVFAHYSGTQMSQNIPQEPEDDLDAAYKAANESTPTPNQEDELDAAYAEANKQSAVAIQPSHVETGPEWLQNIGQVGGDVASSVGNAAYKGTQAIGEGMTPLKMAAIVPSLAVAPAASALAEGVAGIPYLGAAANYIAGAAPEGANLLTDLGYRATSGAAQGAIANKLMGGGAAQGAISGGILNPALGIAGRVAGPVFNAVSGYGGNVSPETAKLAETAAGQYNIKVPGGLLNNNPLVNKTYSLLDRLGMTPGNENTTNFAKAAASTFGENSTKLTRDVMDNAEDRIGNMFDDVWKQTPELKISDNTLNKLAQIRDEASTIMPNDARIPKQIDNLLDIAAKNNGAIPSADAKYLTSTKSPLHKLTRLGPDPVSDYAMDLKNTLYDALGESAPKDVLDKYSQAKQFYKNYKTVELAKPDPVTGELSPTSIANAVARQSKKFGSNGLRSLQTLGDIGQQFRLSPSSGTAENNILGKVGDMLGQQGLHMLGQGGALSGGYFAGGPVGAGAAFTIGNGAGRYLSSDMYRNHLIDAALNRTPTLDLLRHTPEISNALIANRQAATAP